MARTRNPGKPDNQVPEKTRKLTFSVPADLARRFAVHAEMMDLDKTQLFLEMIKTHCRRFSVHDRAKDSGGDGGAGEGTAA